jgi:hypothetical protein
MLNKLLIKLLNHKLNKLMLQKCKQCTNTNKCFDCYIFYNKRDIENVIIDLELRNICA